MTADGGSPRRIYGVDAEAYSASAPDWSPDGRWLVFSVTETATRFAHLFKIRTDGSGLAQLTTRNALDQEL